jgi:hypothetical protein
MLEGKITPEEYAKDLRKSVRKARNSSTGRYVSRKGKASGASA